MTPKAWPESGRALFAELADAPGRMALVVGADASDKVLNLLAVALETQVISAGSLLTGSETPPTVATIRRLLDGARIIDDTDFLFTPEVAFDPLAWLRDIAKRHPTFMRWPGAINDGIATYSETGRRDHYEQRVTNAVLLYPSERAFPDQSPYRIERIP